MYVNKMQHLFLDKLPNDLLLELMKKDDDFNGCNSHCSDLDKIALAKKLGINEYNKTRMGKDEPYDTVRFRAFKTSINSSNFNEKIKSDEFSSFSKFDQMQFLIMANKFNPDVISFETLERILSLAVDDEELEVTPSISLLKTYIKIMEQKVQKDDLDNMDKIEYAKEMLKFLEK